MFAEIKTTNDSKKTGFIEVSWLNYIEVKKMPFVFEVKNNWICGIQYTIYNSNWAQERWMYVNVFVVAVAVVSVM